MSNLYEVPNLATTVKGPMKRGCNFLATDDTRRAGSPFVDKRTLSLILNIAHVCPHFLSVYLELVQYGLLRIAILNNTHPAYLAR